MFESRNEPLPDLLADANGMATLSVCLPLEEAQAFAHRLEVLTKTAMATKPLDDTRTFEQMQADIFVGVLVGTKENVKSCVFPGCESRASDGDPAPLCEHHNRMLRETDWQLLQPEPGRFVWITPTGRRGSVGPEGEWDLDP